MGKLQFENLEYLPVQGSNAWVSGRWTLYRVADTLAGNYSLLWTKSGEDWLILRDHSDRDCN